MHRGLGDADDRSVRDLAGGAQAGIVEAGDEIALALFGYALAHLVEHAERADRLVVMPLDRDRTHGRADRDDLRARPGDRRRRLADLAGHRQRRVGIDDLELHPHASLLWRDCGAAPRGASVRYSAAIRA